MTISAIRGFIVLSEETLDQRPTPPQMASFLRASETGTGMKIENCRKIAQQDRQTGDLLLSRGVEIQEGPWFLVGFGGGKLTIGRKLVAALICSSATDIVSVRAARIVGHHTSWDLIIEHRLRLVHVGIVRLSCSCSRESQQPIGSTWISACANLTS